MKRTFLMLGLIIALAVQVKADVNQYNPYQGWFWYKNPPKKEKQIHKQKKVPKGYVLKTYTYKQLWNMYPDQLKHILRLTLKQAVQNPTPQNVKQYMILLDLVRRKAAAFTNVYSYVLQTSPNLNVYKDYPENTPGIRLRTGLIDHVIKKDLVNYRNDYALLFFYKPGCPYCELQQQILSAFVDQFGWKMMPVNIYSNYEVATRFNVTFVPEIILIHKGSSQWIPVATGLTALNILERNIYRGIEYFQGRLSPQNWTVYGFQKNGSFNVKKLPVNPDMKFKILMEKGGK